MYLCPLLMCWETAGSSHHYLVTRSLKLAHPTLGEARVGSDYELGIYVTTGSITKPFSREATFQEYRTPIKEVKKVLLVQFPLDFCLGFTTLEHCGSPSTAWASLVSYLFLVRVGIHINSLGHLFLMTHVSRLPTQVAHIIWKIPFLTTILYYTKQFNYTSKNPSPTSLVCILPRDFPFLE